MFLTIERGMLPSIGQSCLQKMEMWEIVSQLGVAAFRLQWGGYPVLRKERRVTEPSGSSTMDWGAQDRAWR